ncbi:MAG: hypothetical protein HN350_09725 [Phycisphaerales bacterium]|jgi:hypothetical protein|nr:hypothetical protein [Phycisphaerales bacterium]
MANAKVVGIIVMVIGGCLAWFGVLEHRVGSQASTEPVAVELADLENGSPVPDNNILIGLHHCMYNSSVIEYEYDDDGRSEMRSTSPVNWIWTPLISDKHSYMQGIRKLIKTHGSLKKVPKGARWPVVKDFVVLLKSEVYDTVGDIPDGRKTYESVYGLVINQIESLGEDEKRLIRRKFPKIDFDKVLIVEHGRKPLSAALSISIIVGGCVLFLIPVVLFLGRLGGASKIAAQANPK